jgi:hypothetical protein
MKAAQKPGRFTTARTLNSSSRPNNIAVESDNTWVGTIDVASVMLVASLLDVVEDQQHRGATSPQSATTRASAVRRPR